MTVGKRRQITRDDQKKAIGSCFYGFSQLSTVPKSKRFRQKDSRLYPTRDIEIKIGEKYYGGDLASQSQKLAQSQDQSRCCLIMRTELQ